MRSVGSLGRALSFAIALGVACTGTTGSRRFDFDARARGGGTATFVNAKGWSVTLDKTTVTMGPIYANSIAPLRTSALDRFLRPKNAHALDEEHLEGGRVVGELLGQVTFDALSASPVPFASRGTIEETAVRTLEIAYYPPPGTAVDTLKIDAPAVEVSGRAERAGVVYRFRGRLVLDDAWLPDPKPGVPGQTILPIRLVRGVPAGFVPHPGGSLEIRFRPEALFEGADFSVLDKAPADADGTRVLVQSKTGAITTDQVMRNVFNGVRATSTYTIAWIDR